MNNERVILARIQCVDCGNRVASSQVKSTAKNQVTAVEFRMEQAGPHACLCEFPNILLSWDVMEPGTNRFVPMRPDGFNPKNPQGLG